MIGRSRIDISTVPARSRAMPSLPYDVGMLIGATPWGPMNVATVCIDYPDFYEKFGSFLASYHTTLAAKLFFDSGGKRLVMTRVCHITDHTASATPASAVKATKTFKTASGGTYSAQNTLKVDALYYGTRGNALKIKILAASDAVAGHFDLLVYESTELLEWFRNLSMLDSDDRYVEDIINTSAEKSKYITVTDLALGGTGGLAADERPDNDTAGSLLTGGDDGLASLNDADYVGAAAHNTGLYAFNLQQQGDILFCPDNTSTTFQNAAATYCETQKKGKAFFITDPPANSDKSAIVSQASSLTASEYRSGIYWPRVKISNPSLTIFGKATRITVAPSPLIAGRMAKNSDAAEEKYFKQPGNEVFGLLDLAVDIETDAVLEDSVRDYVTDYKINPIVKGIRSTDGNFGVWMDDVLLGKTSDNFISVGEQRGVSYLRGVFEGYLQQHRTQGNSQERRRTIQDAFEAELLKWTANGAFSTKNASQAFYVNADPDGTSLNNPAVQDEQRLRILVGLATQRPARFIELMFTRDNRAVESWIQQQLSASSSV